MHEQRINRDATGLYLLASCVGRRSISYMKRFTMGHLHGIRQDLRIHSGARVESLFMSKPRGVYRCQKPSMAFKQTNWVGIRLHKSVSPLRERQRKVKLMPCSLLLVFRSSTGPVWKAVFCRALVRDYCRAESRTSCRDSQECSGKSCQCDKVSWRFS